MDKKLKFFGEVLGLSPLPLRLKQAAITFWGEENVPPSKIGTSSLKQLYPGISPGMWRGRSVAERQVIISNLYNHTQTPIEKGWSVAKTQTLDFRGGKLTYNSHNGTDFAIPVGTKVCTAAPGKVVAVLSQFNRGGLKIFIDHGQGLMTCYAHLARALVSVGDILTRGQEIAISGYSGVDGFFTFPWGIPHVHFNAWHNSFHTDPFSFGENAALWSSGNHPSPAIKDENSDFIPSEYDSDLTQKVIDSCLTPRVRQFLSDISCPQERAVHTIIEMNYYPTRFQHKENLYTQRFDRAPLLDLPFSENDFDGIIFLDQLLENRKRKRRIKK